MKKSDLQEIIKEELRRQRKRLFEEEIPQEPQAEAPAPAAPTAEPTNAGAGLNPKKSVGIIAGAIKTLINSGALQGVDQRVVKQLTRDVITNLQTSVKGVSPTAVSDEVADTEDLEDEPQNAEQNAELDDQNQYDPDLSKQVSSPEDADAEVPAEEEAPEDDMGGLFEAKDLKKIFK